MVATLRNTLENVEQMTGPGGNLQLALGDVRSVTARDFDRGLTEVRPSTRAWFETARNFVLFANDGGLYDDLQTYMRARKLL